MTLLFFQEKGAQPGALFLSTIRSKAKANSIPDGCVEASSFIRQVISNDLRAMREAAGLTQAELAKRLHKSQAMVSGAEKGTIKTGLPYAKAVLKACDLPEDWKQEA